MKINILLITSFIILLFSCGKESIVINQPADPKIVINAFLYPEQRVEKISITRNWPINVDIEYNKVILYNADVVITDLTDGADISYPLIFNPDSGYFQYNGADLMIEYGGTYRLDVSAEVDNVELSASATTRVPLKGFKIIDSLSIDSTYIFKSNHSDQNQLPRITIQRSENTDFYIFSIVALDATIDNLDNFIYENPWAAGDIKEKDIVENFNVYKYNHEPIFNTPMYEGISEWEIMKYHLWFYSRYRVIAYACDKNYKDYYLSHASVQEMDGNFHEPVFHVDGEGIGVFGSVITDTLYFDVK